MENTTGWQSWNWHPVLVTKTSQLMLSGEIIAAFSQIHTEHINALCGQNVPLLKVKLAVHLVTTGVKYKALWYLRNEIVCNFTPEVFWALSTL